MRAGRLSLLVMIATLVTAPATAQQAGAPIAAPYDEKEARALFSVHCGKGAVTISDRRAGFARITFTAEQGQPARLILCLNDDKQAAAVPINSLDGALVFMAYKPFAPFWPAAEARWGSDLSALRYEIRATPIEQSLAGYPYARLMEYRYARAMAASRNAGDAGDHAEARALVEREIARIAALEAKWPGKNDDLGFELSLLIGRLANLHARQEGPSAGADLMRELLANHPVPDQYRTNTDINHAALLAEAGRADEAYAIIAPLMADFQLRPEDADRYNIPGSVREFSWIMACTLHQRGDAEGAVPYTAIVNSYDEQPIDPYVTWTKSSVSIRLRMNKCTNDREGWLASFRQSRPSILSPLWIELQDQGRPLAGHYRFEGLTASDEVRALAADYRQLPETYWPALRAWRPVKDAE